ncbi:MAG: alpha/beta hydrolase-fold protein [bacterium]|nr:alpha/beta hydrolase-fold protein [bacterium]
MPNWTTFDQFLSEAQQAPADQRQRVVDDLLRERTEWPWAEANGRATFIHVDLGRRSRSVAVNLDTIKGDPPFAPMTRLEGTNLWHTTLDFTVDALLDYTIVLDDPMTPLEQERDLLGRIQRYWHSDPLNPVRMNTPQMTVSVLHMPAARPFPDWSRMLRVPRGRVYEHITNSAQLGFSGRKTWVYVPPDYDNNPRDYPLLIFQDGQWAVGPLQIPLIADALIKHKRMEPTIIAMQQSGERANRIQEYVSNDRHYASILVELLPFLQSQYRVDPANLGIGGVGPGAIAAAHAALKNPAVFAHLIMISPPLGKGIAQEQLRHYLERFEKARVLPRRIFQSVGRYETRSRFVLPAQVLNSILSRRSDVQYQYVETGSGHGLVGFRGILPEALSWAFPEDGIDQ